MRVDLGERKETSERDEERKRENPIKKWFLGIMWTASDLPLHHVNLK